MSWQFYGGTLDAKKTRENLVFFFGVDPAKVLPMMDEFRDLNDEERGSSWRMPSDAMQEDKRRIVLGRDRLKAINKQVGERISLFGINYQGIDLDDCEIIRRAAGGPVGSVRPDAPRSSQQRPGRLRAQDRQAAPAGRRNRSISSGCKCPTPRPTTAWPIRSLNSLVVHRPGRQVETARRASPPFSIPIAICCGACAGCWCRPFW